MGDKPWKRHERDTAEAIRNAGLDPDADRAVPGAQNREAGGGDIVLPSLPWVVECGTRKGRMPDVLKKLEEAESYARKGQYPIMAAEKRNGPGVRRDRLYVLREGAFLDLAGLVDW